MESRTLRPPQPVSTLTRAQVDRLLDPRKRILVAGELILDEFIWGKVSRISPEAPVPVVEVTRETCNAGGAANVARNLREFLEHVHMLGLAGQDAAAARLHELLVGHGIHLDCVQVDPAYTTICKTRVVARHQQLVRIDRETRTPMSAAQRERAVAQFAELLPSIDAVILEDYAKGLLDQELADAIISLARAAGKIVAVDPKPANTVVWHDITCITPNRAEAFLAAGVLWSDPVEPPEEDAALLAVGAALLVKWRCEYLLVTLSEQGMMLFQSGHPPVHIPTRAQQVFDVSGAGDTAIALFTAALAGGATAYEAAEISNHASGIVVGKLGTATVTREELLASFPA
jgi:D-beta-D-heptose 7-phosphate kinase/D-beta-D-heptose 1-phosphate adenosyltransferase